MEEKVEEEARASELESSVGLHPHGKLLSSYLGLSFSLFLALLPSSSSISQLSTLHLKLLQAEQELCRLKSRRKEDSKANARVVEIFAGHREGWRREEKRMVDQIHAAAEEIACLRARVAELERSEAELKARVEELTRDVGEREEMLGFVAREREEMLGFVARESQYACLDDGKVRLPAAEAAEEEVGTVYGQPEFVASASKLWSAGGGLWQDVQYEPVEPLYHMKHFVARRESPWKVDGESTGVSSKLKLLEQELLNLERVGKSDLSKVPSLMRKQAKRYQALSGKIDDLCQRMQASDPCEPTLSSEFRTQRQTEFLLEAFRLQQRASETGQKFMALQTETGKSRMGGGGGGEELGLSTKRSLDSIRNNLKEIQRNLEIWLARIIGDLEGILARDGASRVREYYISRYPFVQ